MDGLDELRLNIAKAKGLVFASWWSIHPLEDCKGIMVRSCHNYNEIMLPDDKGDCPVLEYAGEQEGYFCWKPIPDWTHDIAAAMTLVDEMPYFSLIRTAPNRWQCQSAKCSAWGDHVIEQKHPGEDKPYYRCGCVFGRGETAPEAISRAYLAWKNKVQTCTP